MAFTDTQIDGNRSSSNFAINDSSTLFDAISFAAISLSVFKSASDCTGSLFSSVINSRKTRLFTYVVESGKKREIEAPQDWLKTFCKEGKVTFKIFLSFGGSPLCRKSTPKSEINQPSMPNVPDRKKTVWGLFWRQILLILSASACNDNWRRVIIVKDAFAIM